MECAYTIYNVWIAFSTGLFLGIVSGFLAAGIAFLAKHKTNHERNEKWLGGNWK